MHKEMVSELVSGYTTYAEAGDLTLDATSAAPATSPVCATAVASSVKCAAATGGILATVVSGC